MNTTKGDETVINTFKFDKLENTIEESITIDVEPVIRPWGSFQTVLHDKRYKVKRIIVNPGASLSLQMHYHRSEHWIVVRGTATVVCGEKEFILTEDQSTYIPSVQKHRLINPGKIPLELMEVQTGSYLGEDDIVRFSDDYGRVE